MNADQFKSWRKANHLKQKDAAELLGLKKRMIQYYEKGHRDGRSVKIPKSIRLACYAISEGVMDFDGKHVRTLDNGTETVKGKDSEKRAGADQSRENGSTAGAVTPDRAESPGSAEE